MKTFSNKNIQKGFTLLEALISIFILTLAITGPIYIASFAFRNTIDSRDNISAQYLAEEVVELIKNRRDERMLNFNSKDPINWLNQNGDYLTDSVNCLNTKNSVTNICDVVNDGTEYIFESCPSGNCPPLKFDDKVGNNIIYGSNNDPLLPDSKFTREFYLQVGTSDLSPNEVAQKEVKLVVNIKWKDRGRDKVYTLVERLYNINYVNYFIE